MGKTWKMVTQACCSPWGCKESDVTEWLNWLKTWKAMSQKWIYKYQQDMKSCWILSVIRKMQVKTKDTKSPPTAKIKKTDITYHCWGKRGK